MIVLDLIGRDYKESFRIQMNEYTINYDTKRDVEGALELALVDTRILIITDLRLRVDMQYFKVRLYK